MILFLAFKDICQFFLHSLIKTLRRHKLNVVNIVLLIQKLNGQLSDRFFNTN